MSTSIDSILEDIAIAGTAYKRDVAGSRESLIEFSRTLVAALEIPSEFVQRSFWAEPALSAHCKLAVQVGLFQHLRDSAAQGISCTELAKKTSVDPLLLQRIMRHLTAMKVVAYSDNKFFGTALSDGLAADNFQQSISFCYDVARPSFNNFPAYLAATNYNAPSSHTDGPFQAAHGTQLAFFSWLNATPPHLADFAAFMSGYRAGKANWYDPGFYPVVERLSSGFDKDVSEVLLVDVGGGQGHDTLMFTEAHPSRPGTIILQDQDPVIARIQNQNSLPFDCMVHDFFTPQPIKSARAYSLHSILHDWNDEQGVQILQNLKSALKPGYSRVLLVEIILSEERPTIAATSMDMMMLAHFAVRERTEAEWKDIIAKAGLTFLTIYSYPGVAESVIEAELREDA